MKNLKVLIITDYWKNSAGGGIKTYLTNFVDELKKNDSIEVNVIFREGDDSENYKINGKLSFSIRSFFVLKKISPDLVLSQEAWYCLLPGYIYKKVFGTRLIHTFHTEPDKKLPLIGKLFMESLLNCCDYVTFVSHGLENKIDDMWKLNFKSKRAITYAGIKSKEVSEKDLIEFCDRFKIRKNSLILLVQAFTDNRLKADGVKLVITSIKKLVNKYPNVILLLTREGRYSNELKEFAKKEGIYEKIIFTGDVNNPYVPLVICDIFIHPWLGKSGVSMVLLEAMVMGKPIVATSNGGISELLEDNITALLVESNSSRVAEKIEILIENKEFAQKLGKNAQKTVEEKFTWMISVNKFLNLSNLRWR